MLNHFKHCLSIALLATAVPALWCSSAAARTIDSPYQVGTWSGFRTAALSYTFDDNCSNQLAVAIPMFNEFGFKVTLFTVTSWVTSWTGLKTAATQGHEIASHTVTHISLGGLSNTVQVNELKNSRDTINADITNQKCVTIAYPNCVEASDAITSQYYFAARGCSGVVELKTPAQFMNISSIVCGSTGSYTTAQSLNGLASQASSSGGWCVLLIHGIDNDGGYSPISSTVLRAHVQHVDSVQSQIWVSTFGNVARYIRERDSVSVKETSSASTSITLQVTDNLDNSVFSYPITLRRPLPSGWTQATVTQNGQKITSSIVGQNMMFDVVPNGGDIVLSSSGTSSVFSQDQRSEKSIGKITAGVSGNNIVFSIRAADSRNLTLALFDMCGRKLAVVAPSVVEPGLAHFAIPKGRFGSGLIVVQAYGEMGKTLSREDGVDKCLIFDTLR
jgi:oligosaccharide reducing-end xylanase